MKSKAAKILIVDDHPVVREGLSLRINHQSDLKVCGEAAGVHEALRLVAATSPDVALIDLSLKDGDGLDLIKRIRARDDHVRLLVCSMYSEALYAERALRAGAVGYINKEYATDKVIEAIRQVLAGKLYLSEETTERLLRRSVGSSDEAPAGSPVEILSDRELQIFRLLGEGLATIQVADRLHLSPKTVETYRARIKEKLGLDSGPELVQRAVRWVLEEG
jgi:DNA-binding NarL/FixJ family response regulator